MTHSSPLKTSCPARRPPRIWLFDLDNTLHNASHYAFGGINEGMNDYIQQALRLSAPDAAQLRRHYWLRYGATLLGLVRHHGVNAAHFLHHTHRLPELEQRIQGDAHDLAALRRLPGRKVLLTNGPRQYAWRVLGALGIADVFDAVWSIEDMRLFGHLRPKPDVRLFRRLPAMLKAPASRCVLVEDTLVHQRSARRVGMGTVWMQRWDRLAHPAHRHARRPAYVDRRIRSLQALCRPPAGRAGW